MKKLLLVTAITFFGLFSSYSQSAEFGAKLGINFSTIYGDTTDDIGFITTIINFGVYSELKLNEKWSFQPELLYSAQGFADGDTTFLLNYLNVPLMGKYYLTKGLSIEAGPQIGILLSAEDIDNDVKVKDNFKTLDFGVNLGVGYKLENGLNFGLRYNVGLSNINDVEGSSAKFRNGTAQVTIGYSFF